MIEHFIDNHFVPSLQGGTFETLNPATNQPLAEVADGSAADIDRAVQAARRAFDQGPWPRLPAAERARLLRRFAELILAHADEIAEDEINDTGVPASQVKVGAIPRAAENFTFFAGMAEQISGEQFPSDGAFSNYAVRKPIGVAGLITPWNTPFMLETWKVAPCLAAGDTCVLKPAEWSPLSAAWLGRIAQEAELPPGVLNIVHGLGETAGAPLVAHPGAQLISFTGETTTGAEILRNGAATLKRFSMELGGKSPTVVFEDADLDRAMDGAVWQVYSLNGERCTAGSRLLLQASIHDEFVAELARRTAAIRVGDPHDRATEVGPLIHPDHWQRVHGHIELAAAEGAEVLVGGGRPPELPEGNYLQPTLITRVNNRMRAAQEEIFGPVLVVIPFRDEAEAIALANDVRYGLAAYVWSGDVERGRRVGERIEAGLVWVNSHNVRDLRTPFGGCKMSGIGRDKSLHAFDKFTQVKTTWIQLG